MSETSGGGGEGGGKGGRAGRQKGERKGGAGGGGRAKRAGAAAAGGESGSDRTYTYESTEQAQRVLRRAVTGFVKAGVPLDVRLEGTSLTLRQPAKEQQTDEYRKLTRRLRPKTGGGGKKGKGKGEGAAQGGGEGGAEQG